MEEKSFEAIAHESEELASNLAQAAELWNAISARSMTSEMPQPDPMNSLPAFTEVWRVWMDHPQELAQQAIDYWQGQTALWQQAALKMLGTSGDDVTNLPNMPEGGKRFAHAAWSDNPTLEYLKKSYLHAAETVDKSLAIGRDEMKPDLARKAAFVSRILLEALHPANFAQINPEVLEATVAEKGQNLVRGLQMMLEDVDRGKGKLLIRQTDMEAFEVGRDMAVSPGQVVWQTDVLQVIQYAPTTDTVHARPILFIPPWINKYYILDLNERKSMVKWLVAQGHTVFMISWVNPDERHAETTWDDYLTEASQVIDVVREETDQDQINIASYCIGGTLTGVMLGLMGRDGDDRVASSTFFTAQLDFEDAGELQCFVDERTLELVDGKMKKGYLPANEMAQAFNLLRSNDLIWSYVVSNYMLGKDPFPFDLLYWNADSTGMPAPVHHYYLETFYLKNRLAKGELELRGGRVTLGDIRGPVYHVATKEDHIAPAASVYRGAQMMTGADVRFVLAGSGHIAGVVNPPAKPKYQYWTNSDLSATTLDGWLAGATETAGSWWPDWDAWLSAQSPGRVPARDPGAVHRPLEPAPGSYVKERFDKR